MIGQTLGHYKILDKLGAGGMGEVYRAEDTRLKRQVALKILPPEMAGSQDRLQRFQREAQTLAALDHPNIVHIYSVEESGGVHFLTMQLVEGKPLSELIPENGMPLEKFSEIAAPLADALQAAHKRGITHRDLKPDNVMIDLEGRVKILDFGLAKLWLPESGPDASLMPTEAMTQVGTVLGTVPYMSPEQVQGEPVDHRTDIFSLGIVLYEMVSGVRPFQGTNSAALMSSILRDTPAPVSEVKTGLPGQLGEILGRCLEKDPERRFQSAGSLCDELRSMKPQEGPESFMASSESASRETWRSRSRWLAMLAAVLIVPVLVGVYMSRSPLPWTEPEAPQITSLAVLPLRNLSGDPAQEYFADGMTEALILDLSKIGALKVISRTSVMRLKETDQSVAELAQALDVDAVVEGSVLREGARVGITVQLIDASTDRSLWAERYERDLTSVFSLQAEVARAIASEIRVSLTPQEEILLNAARTVDPEAHEAYLMGRFYRDRFTPQDLETAMQYFETALEIDPAFALAHYGVGSVWGYRTVLGIAPPREAWPRSEAALARTLELDDSLAEAHLGLANVAAWYEWDWEVGEAEFQRSIELNPNYSESRIFYSHFLTMLGRPIEGTEQAERALELDPLNPFFQGLYGVQLMLAGQHDAAISQFRRTLAAAPGFGFAHQPFWKVLQYKGMYEEALVQAKAHFAVVGDTEVVKALESGYEEGGYRQAMRLAAQTLAASSGTALGRPMNVANLYDAAGDTESALEWIERAHEVRDIDMAYLGVLLFSDSLRSDPRFQEMLRRLKFPS